MQLVFLLEDLLYLGDSLEPAVYRELQVRKILLETEHVVVLQRRDRPILLRVQTLQDTFSGVNYKMLDRSILRQVLDKIVREFVRVELVDAETALHRARDRNTLLHPLHDSRNELRVLHQNSPETPFLHLRGRAPDIQIDLIIAHLFDKLGGLRELLRVVSAELADDRVLDLVELQNILVAFRVQVDRVRVNHLRIDRGTPRQQPHEKPEMDRRNIDHGSDGYPVDIEIVLRIRHITGIQNLRDIPFRLDIKLFFYILLAYLYHSTLLLLVVLLVFIRILHYSSYFQF